MTQRSDLAAFHCCVFNINVIDTIAAVVDMLSKMVLLAKVENPLTVSNPEVILTVSSTICP